MEPINHDKNFRVRMAQRIILNTKGRPVVQKRLAALEAAGIQTSGVMIKYNFGKTGTVKKDMVQIRSATGGKCRNGKFCVNYCPVIRIF